ncbi:hypothetical protein SLINC_0168 [Streptomyces lincolnensis]|uniref:Uncharacterized protein n=1 Tax=Streptomyces lincolnensis TaxID=1915 RepID=A0A1B1M1U7_STRLN|nr:hypothetical protein SLINC_0168 [Streptomyces lincolnensis]AXG51318.1 hypothetical protein SLCG_0163 [Streptomyces lincolnensis]
MAWQEVRRHRPLTYAHSLAEQNLETLRIEMTTTVTEDQWPAKVAEAERGRPTPRGGPADEVSGGSGLPPQDDQGHRAAAQRLL